MLSLFSNTVSYVWNKIGGFSGSSEPEVPVSDSDDEYEDKELTSELYGEITHLNESERFGLINGDIYFSYDAVMGGCKPCIDDKVVATVRKQREADPWKATRLQIFDEDWTEGGKSDTNVAPEHPDSVGIVATITDETISLEDGTEIHLKNAVCEEFKPQAGDIVQFSKETGKLEPSRSTEIEGEVTRIYPDGTGTVNQEIWFNAASCINNYRPTRGSRVVVLAIESRQSSFMWRATKVVPKALPRVVPKNVFWVQNKSPVQKQFLQSLLSDKNGITITSPLDFGTMTQGTKGYITAYIKNEGDKDISFPNCRFQRKETVFTLASMEHLEDNLKDISGSTILKSVKSAYLNIYCNSLQPGKHRELLIFDFSGFEIGRHVTVQIKHPLEDKFVSRNFVQRKLNRNSNITNDQDPWILPGEKPFRTRHYLPVQLPLFQIPEKLRLAVVEKGDIVAVAPSLARNLSMEQYADRFSALLHLEEIQSQLDLRRYDMYDVCLSPIGSEYLSLAVPGLAEGRPSLLIGDRVYLKSPDGTPGPVYQGFIHEVWKDQVLIKFHISFHNTYSGESYNISFEMSRTGMRRCHQAVKQASSLVPSEALFPSVVIVQPPCYQIRGKIKWINEQLNLCQQSAVKRILGHQCRPLPYIIFGPPGTGKTVTLVEAALQVFKNIKSSRLIICAPTNSAADLIAIRLHQSGLMSTNVLARLNAYQRNLESVPECIQKYCYAGDEELGKLIYHRILVSTLGTVGILYGLKINTGHFTHLFLDEAGQATEPETLVAMELVTSAGHKGQVILAGDPKQLGPVLTSHYSKFYGLQLSFLERLMLRKLYLRDPEKFADHGSYDPLLVTKLIENYRSHPALLRTYSNLFYDSELIPSAKNLAPVQWKKLRDEDFPLLFHGIKGEEIREADSPSWFNPCEAVQIVTYLQELYEIGETPESVGIITPYRKQVEKIQLLCGSLEVPLCKIGSVEEFQGQEKRVIILSTVRCSRDDCSELKYNQLGFIGQTKRFNVAISRAQSLLVVTGDPNLLMQDREWRALLRYCVDKKAYIGCEIDLQELSN